MNKIIKKTDIIIIAGALLAAALIFLCLKLFMGAGAYVQITIDGKLVNTLPLNENTTYLIESEGGENTLVIEDGYAYVSGADCPDKICAEAGKINKDGQSIICLPHKVVVSIVSEGEEEIDGVAE